MALVGYSDSEGSEVDESEIAPAADGGRKFERTASKKIKVDLSSLTSNGDSTVSDEPASKRQRKSGAFKGFNSLLPAPRMSAQSAPKRGISLKTSSEAAFSREPVQRPPPAQEPSHDLPDVIEGSAESLQDDIGTTQVKPVGKATRFVPLSVANAKKKKKKSVLPTVQVSEANSQATKNAAENVVQRSRPQQEQVAAEVQSRPRRSLFAVEPQEQRTSTVETRDYEPEFSTTATPSPSLQPDAVRSHAITSSNDATNLGSVAADLNLSASERRRLFGRNAKRDDVKIAHFDMDAEYKANQDIAAKGDLVEHRAVKAIAPGKHSLQQLVNNVRGQTDAIEDKWAEGRRNRAETGNRYGW